MECCQTTALPPAFTVFGAAQQPLGGVSSPATQFQLKPVLQAGETSATVQEPPLWLWHKSPAPLWFPHKGLHPGSSSF